MSSSDALRQLQIGFFGLPSDIEAENITRKQYRRGIYRAAGRLFDGLQDHFYFRSSRTRSAAY